MDSNKSEFAWLLLLYVMMVSGQSVLMLDCTVQISRCMGPKRAVGQPVHTWVGPDDNTSQRFAGPCSGRIPLTSVTSYQICRGVPCVQETVLDESGIIVGSFSAFHLTFYMMFGWDRLRVNL